MIKNNELVSVIVPCYNLGLYIEEALESVKKQTYDNIEIIIVDDGSTDEGTLSLLEKIKKTTDMNVIFQKNTGPSGARNRGIKEAKGKYILCLDPDDKIYKGYIKHAVDMFENSSSDIGIVTSWLKEFNLRGSVWKSSEYNPGRLLVENVIHTASVFKKEAWEKSGGYKTEMKGGYEDWEYWISIVELGYKWIVIPKIYFMYQIRDNSLSFSAMNKHNELYSKIISFHQDMYRKYANEIAYISSDIINTIRVQSGVNNNEARNTIKEIEIENQNLINTNNSLALKIEELKKINDMFIVKVVAKIVKVIKRH